MSWWGKVVGGTVGFMLGGPLGAVLGAALGHSFDRQQAGPEEAAWQRVERTQTAFFTATFTVMGHMAKADGRVSPDEIRMANQVMERMELPEPLRQLARRLFTQGKSPQFPLDDTLAQLGHETRSRDLLRVFLEIQVFAAYADGRMHPAEHTILARICEQLGFDRQTLAQVEALVQAELVGEFSSGEHGRGGSLEDAYALLGVGPEDDDAGVKRAYRRAMSQHHPDKLVAKGLPEEMMKLANAKAQEIKGAYELIKSARGMR